MQTFIEEYIAIENDPRNHRKKGQLIIQFLAQYPHLAQPSFADLLVMLDKLKLSKAKIRMPLFAQLIYPVLIREIEAGNMQAIKVLLQYPHELSSYQYMTKRYDEYSERRLVRRYLQDYPDDRDMLLRLKAQIGDTLYYAIHMLPYGILFGRNSANIDGCQDLQAQLEQYQATCQKLGIDRSDEIRYYAMHLRGYQDYLSHRDLYKDYPDYIQKNNLELQDTLNYYYISPKKVDKQEGIND